MGAPHDRRLAAGNGEEGQHNAPDDPGALSEAAGRALFRLGRQFGRATPDAPRGAAGAAELSRVLVAQAVEALATDAGDGVTIGAVADWLDLDPSTASRLVGDAIRDGYLTRAAASTDARRAHLTLTARGQSLAGDARAYQRGVFDTLTSDWTAEERREFARLFVRFADGVRALRRGSPPPNT